jgi:hypothetical protein
MCQTKVDGTCALTGKQSHNHKWIKVKLYGPRLTPDKTKQAVSITGRRDDNQWFFGNEVFHPEVEVDKPKVYARLKERLDWELKCCTCTGKSIDGQ